MGDKRQRGTIHAEGVEVRPMVSPDWLVGPRGSMVPADWFTPDPEPYDGWYVDHPMRSLGGQWFAKIQRTDGSTHDVCYRATAKEAKDAAETRLAELRDAARSTP